jgi:hypothetical protein
MDRRDSINHGEEPSTFKPENYLPLLEKYADFSVLPPVSLLSRKHKSYNLLLPRTGDRFLGGGFPKERETVMVSLMDGMDQSMML